MSVCRGRAERAAGRPAPAASTAVGAALTRLAGWVRVRCSRPSGDRRRRAGEPAWRGLVLRRPAAPRRRTAPVRTGRFERCRPPAAPGRHGAPGRRGPGRPRSAGRRHAWRARSWHRPRCPAPADSAALRSRPARGAQPVPGRRQRRRPWRFRGCRKPTTTDTRTAPARRGCRADRYGRAAPGRPDESQGGAGSHRGARPPGARTQSGTARDRAPPRHGWHVRDHSLRAERRAARPDRCRAGQTGPPVHRRRTSRLPGPPRRPPRPR